jgi:hypothetical protein
LKTIIPVPKIPRKHSTANSNSFFPHWKG